MRSSLALLFVFGAAGVASAQPSEALVLVPPAPSATSGMWLDFGLGATRIDPGNGQTYRGTYARFAPQTTINRMFYLGAEIDIGSFDGSQPSATDTAARGGSSGTSTTTMSSGDTGTLAAAKLVAGARLMAGAFSGGLELAGGVRYASVTDISGVTTHADGMGVVEARGRLDLWVTPHVTIGALAGSDIIRRDEATFALNVGFHFERFDHTRY